MHNFFATCPIGLEKLLNEELQQKWPSYFPDQQLPVITLIQGGIEFSCELIPGLLLNKILKCTSKILLRLKTQKCRDLPKLYNIARKFPWKDYLKTPNIEFRITAKKSRIIHTGKMEDSLKNALSDYFSANKIKQSILDAHQDDPAVSIFVRLFEDNLTISLDTSGELLHIRKDDSFRTIAPIRENIAASLLRHLLIDIPAKDYNLIDPMCGSATFLKEAKDHFQLNTKKNTFEYLELIAADSKLTSTTVAWPFHYFGFDKEQDIINKLEVADIDFSQKDVFLPGKMESKLPNIVICNPPYGKRIAIIGDKQQFFAKLIDSIHRDYAPARLGIIIPTPFERKLKGSKLYFKQNGINVCFLTQFAD